MDSVRVRKGTVSVGQIRPIIGHIDIDKLAELISKQNLTAREVEKLLKPKNKINKKLQIQNENSDIENRKLEEKIEQQIGLKTNIYWNSKQRQVALNYLSHLLNNLTQY